jgi:hypothetical protein
LLAAVRTRGNVITKDTDGLGREAETVLLRSSLLREKIAELHAPTARRNSADQMRVSRFESFNVNAQHLRRALERDMLL